MCNHRYLPGACVLLACLLIVTGSAMAAGTDHADETARTRVAVMAVDHHWMQAEINGNTAWLSHLLLPEYRSIGADGEATSRAEILASAAKHRGSDAFKRKVQAWIKAHPTKKSVVLHGNVAILSFYDPERGAQEGVRSSDIFVYEDGRWRALYSQHSKISG